MSDTVAALFVEAGGVYYGLPNVDPWDHVRDARLYNGPHPVVAHPPCNRWCQMAFLNQRIYGYRVGEDGGCFAAALAAVRRFGGVLEHPAHSYAWATFDLPEPMTDGWQRAFCGGWVARVDQGMYGHRGRKSTWLYASVDDPPALRWERAPSGAGWWLNGRTRLGADRLRDKAARATPPAFRDVLLEIARSARKPGAASPEAALSDKEKD